MVSSSKSMSRAEPSVASIETVWSMPPVGAPTYSVSARTQAWASRSRTLSVRGRSSRPATATATAHSRAAELDRPAPIGTSLSMRISSPGTSSPPWRIAQSTPVT